MRKKMLIKNKVCYTRKKQQRLHEKELKTGKKITTFKRPRTEEYKFSGFK